MARTRGAKDTKPRKRKGQANNSAPEQSASTDTPPQAGHNSAPQPVELTDDEVRALTFDFKRQLEAAEAAIADARLARKDVVHRAKATLGDSVMADIAALIAASTPEGEAALQDDIKRKVRALQWSGTGMQLELFPDRTPAVDLAYDQGKVAGMDGTSCRPPHDPSVPQYNRWIDGWNDGQAALQSAFRKLEPPTEEDGDLRPPFMQQREAEAADAVDNIVTH